MSPSRPEPPGKVVVAVEEHPRGVDFAARSETTGGSRPGRSIVHGAAWVSVRQKIGNTWRNFSLMGCSLKRGWWFPGGP